MISRLLAVALFPLVLTACQTSGTAPIPPISPIVGGVVGLLPEQIVDQAKRACSFAPTFNTVQSLIAAFGGPAIPGIVNLIVSELCTAVDDNKKMAMRSGRRASTPIVRGVRVRGSFVR